MESQSISAEENRMANPMELSEEIQSSGSRKRKADDGGFPLESSDDLEDDGVVDMVGYDEKQGGDPEESDVSSREEGQEWDVDSFDDGFDYRPKRNLDPNDELGQKMHRYRSQMYRSKGFDVDRENIPPGNVAYRPLGPIDLDKPFRRTGLTGREFMHNMIALALERYNRIKGSTVTCEHIVRAIVALVSGVKSYITFMAREVPDGDLVEYQAKTEQRVYQRKPHVIFCRPAPKPKDPTDDDFVYTDSSSDVEDSDVSSRGSGQEWDVDSLDDKPEYKLPRVNIPSDDEVEKMRLYRPKMYKSKGFNVDGECYSGRMLYFSPVDLDENLCPYKITGREYMQNMVDLALESYNKIKGSTVTCEYIVRANLTNVGGFKSYITFMAREVPGGDLVEYQAKTEKKFSQKKAHAIFCRPSPKPKGNIGIIDPIVSGLEDKLSTWTFLPKENGEDLQVLRYEHGQKYDAHFDYFHDKVNIARGGHGIATVLLYLSNVTKGGETVFPDAQEFSRRSLSENKDDLSDCAKKGIAVKPKKGNALLFFNLHQDAVPDILSLHGGCPVIEGEKWSATKWIHVDSFDKVLTHDGNCTDVNESCERWAVLGECGKNPEYMVGTPELPGNCRRSCKAC